MEWQSSAWLACLHGQGNALQVDAAAVNIVYLAAVKDDARYLNQVLLRDSVLRALLPVFRVQPGKVPQGRLRTAEQVTVLRACTKQPQQKLMTDLRVYYVACRKAARLRPVLPHFGRPQVLHADRRPP